MSEQVNERNEVGYKKPPKHTRFKPGQSGNPKGRRKGSKNFETLVGEELEARLTATDEHGNKVVMTKKEALAKKVVFDSLKGKPKSFALLMPFMAQHERKDLKRRISEERQNIDYNDPEAAHKAWQEAQQEAHDDDDI